MTGRPQSETARPAVYLASPLGFDEPGRHYRRDVLLPALERTGWLLLDPWAPSASVQQLERALALPVGEADAALRSASEVIGRHNVELLDAADAVLAWLDGVDLDSGTAAEVGYASGRGTPVVAVRTDIRLAGDHAAARVNLQVEHFVTRTGGSLCASLEAALAVLGSLLGQPQRPEK